MFPKQNILILNIGKLRFQKRNFSYSNPLVLIMTRPEIRLHNFKHYVQK